MIQTSKLHYAIERIAKIEPEYEGQYIRIALPPPEPMLRVYDDSGAAPPAVPEFQEIIEFMARYIGPINNRTLAWFYYNPLT